MLQCHTLAPLVLITGPPWATYDPSVPEIVNEPLSQTCRLKLPTHLKLFTSVILVDSSLVDSAPTIFPSLLIWECVVHSSDLST